MLTGFIDPKRHKFDMVRNDSGDLLSMATPAGKRLHFEYDDGHRIRSIRDSLGHAVRYEYDAGGGLVHVRDSDGQSESYTLQ